MINSLKSKGKLILDILKPRMRLSLFSLLTLGAVAFFAIFFYGSPALAQSTSPSSIADAIVQAIAEALLWVASIFNSISMFIIHFVVEIASYNNYINSQAVILGWVLVRDVTNMFFVIILMVIAFGTVLGIEQYEWKKMLVKFVLAAILVNFSRIICGIIIDAAQVFMMTFISGVAAVAGGNLMNALSINDISSFSKNGFDAKALTSGNIFASAMVVLIFSFAAMMVIGSYLVVLMARLVALWVLIVLSPLVFVLGVIPKFQSYAGEWWQHFTNYVITGPILAFFLWLSFAVAGGGSVHSTEFSEPNVAYPLSKTQAEMDAAARDSGSDSSIINEILQMEVLASFIIAVALLMAGVKVTQRVAGIGAGALGTAFGAVSKFATYAGGVAAARWAVGQAGAGAKWAVGQAGAGAKALGKGALMKAPLIGGDAWIRRGRAIKAGVSRNYQDVMQKYEKGAADRYKKAEKQKGIGGFLKRAAFGATLTTAQKEKKVSFLEGAAKFAKEERMEKLGMGGTRAGMLAGSRMMRAEIAKQEAERDKKRGLGIAKTNEYRRVGKHDLADMVEAGIANDIFDEDTKKYANLDQASKLNIAREMANTTQTLRDNLLDAVESGDEKIIESAKSQLKEQMIKNMNFQAIVSSEADTREGVDELFLGKSGYSGGVGTENSPAMEMSRISGLDAANTDHQEVLKNLQEDLEKDVNFQTSAKQLSKAEYGLYSHTGNLRYASSLSQGLVEDEKTNRMKVVYGMGANIGTHDIEGKKRTEERDVFTTDKGKITHLSTVARPNFQQNTNAEIIIQQKDRATGQVQSLDYAQMGAMSRYLSAVSPQMMRRAFSPKFVEDINAMAKSGRMTAKQATEFLNTVSSKMTNDQQKGELRGVLKELDILARSEGGGNVEVVSSGGGDRMPDFERTSYTGAGTRSEGGSQSEEDEIEASEIDEDRDRNR